MYISKIAAQHQGRACEGASTADRALVGGVQKLQIERKILGQPEKACRWYIQRAHNDSSLEKKRKEVCVEKVLYGGPPELT